MRQFYEAYQVDEISPPVTEISRTKNLIILDKCEGALQRAFYIRRTAQFGWSKSVLIHQIENQTYQKTDILTIQRLHTNSWEPGIFCLRFLLPLAVLALLSGTAVCSI
jgi:predicted nuclease of restriction endonuclease-like (RecB) superfamily